MLFALIVIWSAVALCAVMLLRGPAGRLRRGLETARHNALFMLSRIPFAFLGAGFAATLLPERLVGEWLGGESGIGGILLASLVGGFVPSGPMVSFPVALALYKAGVGVPQLVAFITAWSVLAVHRLITWEVPLLGGRFAAIRYVASLPLAPIAGVLAGLMV